MPPVKNVGEPCAGEPHARFDGGREETRPVGKPVRPRSLPSTRPEPTALQSGSDAAYPTGQRNYWKSHYVDQITEGAVATLKEHARRMPSPLSFRDGYAPASYQRLVALKNAYDRDNVFRMSCHR